MSACKHDPGGKIRLKLTAQVRGSAKFSPCGRYRQLLTRNWDGSEKPGTVLFIGMNPSTAAEDVDDPTVFKETKLTRRWGYGSYVKCNVMDYRATHPKMLLAEGVLPCSDDNLPAIITSAKDATLVVMAYGSLHKKLSHYGQAVTEALRGEGIKLHALRITKNGSPGHPLYLRDDSELLEF